jgi:hypothetical protein
MARVAEVNRPTSRPWWVVVRLATVTLRSVTDRCWHPSNRVSGDREVLTPGPQSENKLGGQAVVNGRIEGLGGRVVRETQDVAAADTGQPASPGNQEEAQGTHAADQVRIGAFPGAGFGLGKVSRLEAADHPKPQQQVTRIPQETTSPS